MLIHSLKLVLDLMWLFKTPAQTFGTLMASSQLYHLTVNITLKPPVAKYSFDTVASCVDVFQCPCQHVCHHISPLTRLPKTSLLTRLPETFLLTRLPKTLLLTRPPRNSVAQQEPGNPIVLLRTQPGTDAVRYKFIVLTCILW